MSHSHEDRIADRPAYLCAAYGCPLLGSSANSTSGAADWWCHFHFGADAGQMQGITSAIRSAEWLANVLTMIRTFPRHPDKHALLDRIRHDLELNGRPELVWDGRETIRQWSNRIEPEFTKLVIGHMPGREPQAPAKPGDTWAPASSHLPNFS